MSSALVADARSDSYESPVTEHVGPIFVCLSRVVRTKNLRGSRALTEPGDCWVQSLDTTRLESCRESGPLAADTTG